ncbi:hypothetical protein PENTCL1PPCAC_21933, partial [Pristionchus entomophagus]
SIQRGRNAEAGRNMIRLIIFRIVPPTAYSNPYPLSRPGEKIVTVEMMNEEREMKKKEEEEFERKLSAMKLELSIGQIAQVSAADAEGQLPETEPEPSPEDWLKRIEELEKILTQSLKDNIRLEMERDNALENHKRTQLRNLLDNPE